MSLLRRALLSAPFCLSLILPAGAQQAAGEAALRLPSPVFDLGELVVPAPRNRPQWPATVSRVDRQLLDDLDATRLPDALLAVPGVTLNPGNRGGSRNETAFSLRGFDQLRVPVLIDGIPIYVPYDGYLDINRLLLGGAERVEVTKGFAPMVFGPNALGGAVNIISRRPTREVELDARIAFDLQNSGDYSGVRASAAFGTAQERFYAQGSVSVLSQDSTQLPQSFDPGLFQPQGDRLRSSSQDVRLTGKLGVTPNDTDEYAIGFAIQRGERGAPPYAGLDPTRAIFFDWPRYDKDSLYLLTRTALPFGEGSFLRLRGYYDSFRNRLMRYDDQTYTTQRRPFAFDSSYDDYTLGGGIEFGTNTLPGGNIRIAYNTKYDVHREFGPRAPTSEMRDIIHSFGTDVTQRLTPWLTATAGLSYDIREAISAQDPATGGVARFPTGSQYALNGQFGLLAQVNAENDLFANIARRSRFASMFERYSYRLGNGIPNPNLAPERATNMEIGWETRALPHTTIRVAGFYSMVSDFIQAVSVGRSRVAPFNVITQSQNIGEANFYGVELSVEARLRPDLRLTANYTYLVREREDTRTTPFYGTPRQRVFVSATWDVTPRFQLVPSVFGQSDMFTTDLGTRRPVNGFAIPNLRAAYRLNDNLSVEGIVSNITDTRFAYDDGFPNPGRSFRFGLRGTL
jgi:iron complex outermembrane recepter protein